MLPDLADVAEVRRWSDFVPNTDAADLIRGIAIVEDFRPNVILAVGGGSAMDMAKLLAVFRGLGDEATLHASIRDADEVAFREPRLILAPTTSGSGSEATHFAVVYIGDEKYSVAGPALLPDAVILDPQLTVTGSPYQRATSGIDAVAQAIESLWAVGATDKSRGYARHSLGLLVPSIETFVNAPTDESVRAMAIGSHLAGRAINISRTTGAHALSYSITKRYGVSHGHAVALTLGAFIDAHARVPAAALQPTITSDGHAAALRDIADAFDATEVLQTGVLFADLGERLGLPMRLAEVGLNTVREVRELATAVNVERLGNNPVRFSTDELTSLLEAAL